MRSGRDRHLNCASMGEAGMGPDGEEASFGAERGLDPILPTGRTAPAPFSTEAGCQTQGEVAR